MNVLTLNDRPEKLEECLSLITTAFNYPDKYSYKEDFALLTQTKNHSNCYFIEEEGQVVATLFTLPRKLLYKDTAIPVLFLGGISVRDENRGGGLFRSLLETVTLLNSHNALFLLWSDLSSLYEKFSFHEFGLVQQIEEASNDLDILTPGAISLRPQLKKSYEEISQNCLIPERTDEDWDSLLSSSSISFLQDKNGSSYFVGKGYDLQGICHEHYLFATDDSPLVPKYWNYAPSEDARDLRYMGFLRLGNLEVLSELLDYTSGGRLKILERTEGLIKVSFDQEDFELSDRDFIQGLWGPGKITEWIGLVPQIRIMGFDSV
jgi:hypothetical protein